MVREVGRGEVACFLERRLAYLLSEPPLVLVVGEFNTGEKLISGVWTHIWTAVFLQDKK